MKRKPDSERWKAEAIKHMRGSRPNPNMLGCEIPAHIVFPDSDKSLVAPEPRSEHEVSIIPAKHPNSSIRDHRGGIRVFGGTS